MSVTYVWAFGFVGFMLFWDARDTITAFCAAEAVFVHVVLVPLKPLVHGEKGP